MNPDVVIPPTDKSPFNERSFAINTLPFKEVSFETNNLLFAEISFSNNPVDTPPKIADGGIDP